MSLGERELKKMICTCVRDLGHEVDLREFTEWLEANYEFDDDDLKVSPSRPNEFAYQQRIRNLKSHNRYVSGVGICELGYGAYIRWIDSETYVFGSLENGLCPKEAISVLEAVHRSAVVSAFDYLVAELGGKRLGWVRKARILDGMDVDIVLPNEVDEGATCRFIKVFSTTHRVGRLGSLGIGFELSGEFSRLLEMADGYATVAVMVVMEPSVDAMSFGGFSLLEGDDLMKRIEGGMLRI